MLGKGKEREDKKVKVGESSESYVVRDVVKSDVFEKLTDEDVRRLRGKRQEKVKGFNEDCEKWIDEGTKCRERKAYGEALGWFERAVDKGYPRGWAYLAQMYAEGLGVEKSEEEASRLFGLVEGEAKKGNGVAQFSVGRMYHLGHGVAH